MSHAHQNEFERIKSEHDEVIKLLTWLSSGAGKAQKGAVARLARIDVNQIQSAVPNIGDAYALLLIAKAESFMRVYLQSRSIVLPPEPKLSALIDQCRKEFNATSPRVRIQKKEADAVHALRVQRNNYAHGNASAAFP